jgi:hypothetical protein
LIVMKAGQDLNVISPFLFPTIGVSVALTAFFTPYMVRLSYRISETKLIVKMDRRFTREKSIGGQNKLPL